MSARDLFVDPEKYQSFEENGYVVLDLFDAKEMDEIASMFYEYFPQSPPAFFSSSYLSDFDLKKQISDKLEKLIAPKLDLHFRNYRCLGGAFLSKAPDQHSELPMHQDWTIVDEANFLAANIWTPITPITKENGTLQVLPGSHHTFRNLRAPTLPFSGNAIRDKILPHLIPLYVKPGQAVFLDQALVHYSDRNNSDEMRLAFTTGFVSKEANLHFHYWDKETRELEEYEMDDDFLLRWENFHQDIFQRPTFGHFISKRPYQPVLFTEADLDKTIALKRSSTSSDAGLGAFFKRLFTR